MELKVNQFVKIQDEKCLRQINSIQDDTVECWCGGNLVKFYKEYVEEIIEVDTHHLEETK